jgi:translation initiation factor 4G
MSRGGSRRGGERNESAAVGPDGWAIAGSNSTIRAQPKAGDLSNFGKIAKPTPMTFGPSGVFAKGKEAKGREGSLPRTASNRFDMLSQNTEMAVEPQASKSSRPPSRKPSADFTQTGLPEPAQQRRKLNLLPRSKPVEEAKPEASEEDGEDEGEGEGEVATGPSLSEDEAKRKIEEDIKELFNLRILEEVESYFTSLPEEYHWKFVDMLVTKGIDAKAADVSLVGEVLQRANEKNLCSADALEKGFDGLAEIIEDIAIDVPKAFDIMAGWMTATGLSNDEERRSRIASKVPDSGDKLLSLIGA